MGFTLRAALTVLGAKAQIVVAELIPAVVAWARGPMAEVFGASLTDPRVSIEEGAGASAADPGLAARLMTQSFSMSIMAPRA